MNSIQRHLGWAAVAILGAGALGVVALNRGESINALWLVVAAVCVYLIAYRYYSLFIADKVMELDPTRMTPAHRHNDGLDYVPTNKYVLFGHHFAAIAGAGPLVGPVLAAQMGYLPGTLWIVFGVIFAGAVQDFIILFLSVRRDGKSLGEIIRMELGDTAGTVASIGILMIMVILLAVLALVVVKALAGSPWGTFTIAMTIPIALFMGLYMRYIRPGRIAEIQFEALTMGLAGLHASGKQLARQHHEHRASRWQDLMQPVRVGIDPRPDEQVAHRHLAGHEAEQRGAGRHHHREALHHLHQKSTGKNHQRNAQPQTDDQQQHAALRSAGNRHHVVHAHHQVGQHDGLDGGDHAALGHRHAVAFALVFRHQQLDRDPQQQQGTARLEQRQLEQLGRQDGERHAHCHRRAAAPHDGLLALLRVQPPRGQRDDHRVVAREHDVDPDDLDQRDPEGVIKKQVLHGYSLEPKAAGQPGRTFPQPACRPSWSAHSA